MTLEFTFDDIVTSQGTSCASVYDKIYSLQCTSCINPSVQPAWVSTFDPTEASFEIISADPATVGTHTIRIDAALQLSPSNYASDTGVEFTITIVDNPCLLTAINAFPISDMEFTIAHDKTPTVHFFTPFTETVGSCGPIAYTLTGDWPVLVDYPDELVTLDSVAA